LVVLESRCLCDCSQLPTYDVKDLQDQENYGAGYATAVVDANNIAGRIRLSGGAVHAAYFSGDGHATDLGSISGGLSSGGRGIYDPSSGVYHVAGYSTVDGTLKNHAFYKDSTVTGMTDVGTLPGGDFSEGNAINATYVVGLSNTSSGGSQDLGFYYTISTRAINDIGHFSDGSQSTAYAINSSNIVAGWADRNGNMHAMTYDIATGTRTDLGTLGAPQAGYQSVATAVDDNGDVAGWSNPTAGSTDTHAFLIRAKQTAMQDLKTVNSDDTGILAFGVNYINSYQQVVGIYNPHGIASNVRAFVYSYQYSAMCDLTALLDTGSSAWKVLDARAINSDGIIVGEGTSAGTGSQPHALRLKVHTTGPSGGFFGGRSGPDLLLPYDAVSALDPAVAEPISVIDYTVPPVGQASVGVVRVTPPTGPQPAWWEWDGGDLAYGG
jgi:hypothetical protein